MAPNDGFRHSLPGHGHDTGGNRRWASFCRRCAEVIEVQTRPLKGTHAVCGTQLDAAQVSVCPDCQTSMVILSAAAPPRCNGNGRHRLQRAFVWNHKKQRYDWMAG